LTHIAIVTGTPLLAQGLAAALAGESGWQLSQHGEPIAADVLVLHRGDDATVPPLPPGVPVVVIGSALRDWAALPQPLALLPTGATAVQLRVAVAAVLQGLQVRDPQWTFAQPKGLVDTGDHEPLTPRELEVYELLGKGLSNPDIAGVLGISAHTAKYHVGQILAKVGAATRAEAVSAGLRMGIIGL
jgi:DNA-binding CsgD family transcriptional regulator